jgi:hypothetical protein
MFPETEKRQRRMQFQGSRNPHRAQSARPIGVAMPIRQGGTSSSPLMSETRRSANRDATDGLVNFLERQFRRF